MHSLIFQFLFLQLMDFLTTLAFLSQGGEEMNPLVAALIRIHPFFGPLAAQTVALALGAYCMFAGRERLLRRANVLYAVLVVWNVVAIIASGSVLAGGR